MAREANRWLLREPEPASPARLFCLPFAGAGASSFRRWPRRVGQLEVCAVQLPGRENRLRQEAFHDFATFADQTAEAISEHLDRPYALFGQCMGALMAHALAVRLERSGVRPPDRIYVSASLAPHRGFYGLYHPSMTDAELADELRRVAAYLGDGEILPELLPLAIRVLRNDVEMCFGYRPGPVPVRCPITAIGWRDDVDVRETDILEWAGYGDLGHHVLDGNTLTFLKAPPALLRLITTDFAVQPTDPTGVGDPRGSRSGATGSGR